MKPQSYTDCEFNIGKLQLCLIVLDVIVALAFCFKFAISIIERIR